MAPEKIRVTIDGQHTYEAWADLATRWKGWLSPHFPIEEVRRMAEHLQADMNQEYQVDTVHVIDGYQWADDGEGASRRAPAAVVLKIGWDYLAEEGPGEVTEIVTPDEHGRYPVGGFEWTWHQVEDEEVRAAGNHHDLRKHLDHRPQQE